MTTMALDWAAGVSRVAVLTGAGISTDSGIPDYRGPDGVWTRDPAAVRAFTYDVFMSDAAVRAKFWRVYLDHPAWQARPNTAHTALATLATKGIAVRVLTQNIDGLHQRSGIVARKVVELHGTMHETVCTGCRSRTPTDETRKRFASGDTDPRCLSCGGILKLATVLFGERLDPSVMGQAVAIVSASPLLLVIGSSLIVDPVASLCRVAVDRGARLVIVNRDETPYDELATAVIRTPIGEAVPAIVDALTG